MTEQGLGDGPIYDVQRLAGGTQNILLSFARDGRTYIFRRPPLSKRKNSDETMRREARVLEALNGTDVPHPDLIAACPDTDVIGAAFYLMEPIDGASPLPLPDRIAGDPELQRELGESMIDALAALGRVDHVAQGLSTLGRSDGWLTRQVSRWRAQLDSYSDIPEYPGPQLPHLERVATWLDDNIPDTWNPGLIHGDFHYGNVMVARDEPRIAAIVDWELCTIGDPLLDLGHLLANWPDPAFPGRTGVPVATGMPTAAEAVERYARASGRDVSDYKWFAVLACYRLAILLEGSNARAHAGSTTKEIGDMLGYRAKELFEQANALLDSADFN
nr:phosphotransferase family protein [Nocardia sp. 348MFTsu5.1]